MRIITREKAIEIIVDRKLLSLGAIDREIYILDWWPHNGDDLLHSAVPSKDLNIFINASPPEDSFDKEVYDPIVKLGLYAELIGVTNRFLEICLENMNFEDFSVVGENTILQKCRCCEFKTIKEHNKYYICALCGWEDDGTVKDDQYSSPNHMTLGQGKKKFKDRKSKFNLIKYEN